MKRKGLLIVACTAALLQWGCMDYKEFSDIAVDPFQPKVVIPVAADTAYAKDAPRSATDGSSIRFRDDGSAYMCYETTDSVSIDYELSVPKIPSAEIQLKENEKAYDVKTKFGVDYNIAGIIFGKVTITTNAATTLCGATQLNAGVNVFTPAQDGGDALTIHFVNDNGKYYLTSSKDAKVKFSDVEIKKVILPLEQTSTLFAVKKALGHVVLDMFDENLFAHHDFSKAKFSIKVEPHGENITRLPFQFALTNVMASYAAVDPSTYDGNQQVMPSPDRYVESKATVKEEELVLCKSKADDQYTTLSRMPVVGEGNSKTFDANGQNSNLVELLTDGPKYVDCGVIYARYDKSKPLPEEVAVDVKSNQDYILLTYTFELPLEGKSLESLWEHEVLLTDSLPDLNSNATAAKYAKILNLQDDDYVKLYIQFVNRLPFDIYASIEFQSLNPAISQEIVDQMRLNFTGIESIGGNSNLTGHFGNPNFKQFLVAKAASVNDEGRSIGESRNVVSCLMRYSQYKVIQKNAEVLSIKYRVFKPGDKPFVVDKNDFIYVRVGIEVQPTVSYNPRKK